MEKAIDTLVLPYNVESARVVLISYHKIVRESGVVLIKGTFIQEIPQAIMADAPFHGDDGIFTIVPGINSDNIDSIAGWFFHPFEDLLANTCLRNKLIMRLANHS